jgi:hypothetical protein
VTRIPATTTEREINMGHVLQEIKRGKEMVHGSMRMIKFIIINLNIFESV